MAPDLYLNKKVLITGGLGFIGSNLARVLVKLGAKVTIIDSMIPEYGGNFFNVNDFNNQVNINISDVRDPYSLGYLIKGCDFLFNLAGQTSHLDSMINPHEDLDINAAAQLSILEACKKFNPGIRVVFASTRQIYGKPDYLPVDECHPIRPVDVNGINKLAGEWYHLLYSNVYGIKASALRLTNTFGPGMRVKDSRQTFLGVWIRSLLEGKPICVFGDGLQIRDFNYVDDVVNALLMVGVSSESNGKVYNLGSKEIINLTNLAILMIDVFGKGIFETIPFPSDRKAIDIGDYYSDFSLIQSELGWSPKVSLRDGLTKTFEYYVKNSESYWP
jgi:dTDP-glucose 4,6-dehydratase/UDP-glucose 4-epimerase